VAGVSGTLWVLGCIWRAKRYRKAQAVGRALYDMPHREDSPNQCNSTSEVGAWCVRVSLGGNRCLGLLMIMKSVAGRMRTDTKLAREYTESRPACGTKIRQVSVEGLPVQIQNRQSTDATHSRIVFNCDNSLYQSYGFEYRLSRILWNFCLNHDRWRLLR
jgi:hypothetical protein